MTFAQYLRIETSLGGYSCTNKQFIQACLDFILPQAKHHHLYRTARHLFIRDGLAYLNKARGLACVDEYRNIYSEELHLQQCWHREGGV